MAADEAYLADMRRRCRESRAAQGLPPTVQDPAVLDRIAAIFRLPDTREAS